MEYRLYHRNTGDDDVIGNSIVTGSKLKLNSILRNLVNKSKPGFKIGHTSIHSPTLTLFQSILEVKT